MDPEIWRDILTLSEHYAKFLSSHTLVEPSRQHARQPTGKKILLIYPWLFPGYPSCADFLSDVEIWEGGFDAEKNITATMGFASQWDEYDWVFSQCRNFIGQGGSPEEIAIHVPRIDPETTAYLGRFARRYDLQLGYRAGSPLSASSFGRFLKAAAQAGKEGFSAHTVRALFDASPYPWKKPEEIPKILRFLDVASIPERSADPRGMRTLWRESLETMKPLEPSIRETYIGLSRTLDALAGAKSFSTLRSALFEFRQRWLEEVSASLPEEAKIERIMAEMDGLARLEESWGGFPSPISRFDAFLELLDSTTYAASEQEGKIPVYPYHIGSLVPGKLRFALDASQDSTALAATLLSPYPPGIVGNEISQSWDDTMLFKAFTAAGVQICHTDSTMSGSKVAHPFLVSRGMRTFVNAKESGSPEDREAEAWRARDPSLLPHTLTRRSMAAAQALPSMFGRKEYAPVPHPDGPGLAKFNPRSLASLLQCPFKWFVARFKDSEPRGQDKAYLAEGSLTHALVAALLSRIKDMDGRVLKEKLDSYAAALESLVPRILATQLAEYGPALRPHLTSAMPRIRHRIGKVLEFEIEFQEAGWDIGRFEVPLVQEYPEFGILLRGRADRIAFKPNGNLALIDYKRKTAPSKKEFLVDDEGRISDFQIAAYAAILAETLGNPELGMYWSIDLSKPLTVFGPGGGRESWEDFSQEREALAKALEAAGLAVDSERYLDRQVSKEACQDCPGRPLCRAHFHSEGS
jgi:RecB family exonuclease